VKPRQKPLPARFLSTGSRHCLVTACRPRDGTTAN
jgi:hypothetical protein